MSKKNIFLFIITVLVVASVSSLCTASIIENDVNKRIHDAVSAESNHYKDLIQGIETFLEVKDVADERFIGDIDYENIDEMLSQKYVEALGDKYSKYLTKEELESYKIKLSGSFVGIGINCSQKDGKMYVESVLENSPAMTAGIVKGEKIICVEDIVINEENYEEALNAVLGEKGTFVSLKIQGIDGKIREIYVERQAIEVETVKSEMLQNNIGYIKITQFALKTEEGFNDSIDKLLKDGAKAFIFDMRDNPGGALDSVVSILDRLLPEGPIVNIVNGSGKTETTYSTNEQFLDLPMVVLINGNTASAAELFASALRDYKMAELYGEVTYGKGYVQSLITLKDGSGLRISIAKYNPPYGENYEGIGVSPHVQISDDPNTESDEQLEKAIKYFK